MAKPFGHRELLARIKAIVRRSQPASTQQDRQRFLFDRFLIDLDARSLSETSELKKPVSLTSAEFDLFEYG